MKTIADEIKTFLEATGVSQATLSATSGVPASTICNLLNGKRKNLLGPNQDAIRSAMSVLHQAKVPPVSEHPPQPAEPPSPDSMTTS